ncbi:hypothetical protein HRG_010723 [Hirsutella rhossiliensis]|uniref:Uncharacterized protein n=1 Tax=Hirsutella rhossiliensis TaxID=111463 RepID=A0A9P8MSJ5_9HYPO|nr:uncharacterized protein HRG_10723 [Hirsutella rhossiliensis]KAH0958422.1 hypothetical protein HRG_10723 [Hirsutella rhossiliensis]
MFADLLQRIEHDIDKIGNELWNIDGPEDLLDNIFEKLSSLKARVEVRKSLQGTANLLRRQPSDKALPKQQATKVKHFIRFVFRKDSREEGRRRQLRDLDCDTLKFCGLSYSTEEIIKLDDAEFEVLRRHGEEFFHRRALARLLYRPDVDKAVDAKFEDPDDDGSYETFIQSNNSVGLPKDV